MGRGRWLGWIGCVVLGVAGWTPVYSQAPGAPIDSTAAAPTGTAAPTDTAAVTEGLPDSLRVNEGIPLTPTFDRHISAYPYVYYTPETELAFGAGGIVTFYTSQTPGLRPSKILLSGYYSTKAQYKFTLSPEFYFDENRLLADLDLDYGLYVDRYYGIGNNTPDIDEPEYEIEGWGVHAEVQLPPPVHLFKRTRSGLSLDLKQREIKDIRENPNLEPPGPRGIEGGLSSGLGWVWAWDSRDKVFYPRSGVYSRVSGAYYMDAIGSDYDFNRYKVDLRTYRAISEKSVLAIQFFGHWTPGHPPFYELPALGGGMMHRGYYEGRYRDVLYISGQVEYRRKLFWRLGAVGFIAVGDVGSDFSDLKIRETQISGGAGLRVLFNQAEEVNLRVDLGIGKHTTGVYFGLEEAF